MDGEASERSGIQVIARAAAVLRAVKVADRGLSLGQVAQAVGLPRSTVQRIVGALINEHLLVTTGQGGLRLGPEISALGEAARHNLVDRFRPALAELAQATGETADLSVLRGPEMIFLDQVPGTHRLRAVSKVGEVFPLTTTANGRACLAALPLERARALARAEWERRRIDGDLQALEALLDQVRQTGLAEDLGEHTEGISALGFAFRDWSGELHAVSVPVPSPRFAAQRTKVEAALAAAKGHVERVIGAPDGPTAA